MRPRGQTPRMRVVLAVRRGTATSSRFNEAAGADPADADRSQLVAV